MCVYIYNLSVVIAYDSSMFGVVVAAILLGLAGLFDGTAQHAAGLRHLFEILFVPSYLF